MASVLAFRQGLAMSETAMATVTVPQMGLDQSRRPHVKVWPTTVSRRCLSVMLDGTVFSLLTHLLFIFIFIFFIFILALLPRDEKMIPLTAGVLI